MKTEGIAAATQALSALEKHAVALTEIRVPKVFGWKRVQYEGWKWDPSNVKQLTSQAAADGYHAVKMLEAAEVDPAAIESILNSVKHIERLGPNERRLHIRGAELSNAIHRLHITQNIGVSGMDLPVATDASLARIRELMLRAPESLKRREWKELDTLLVQAEGTPIEGPSQLPAAKRLADYVHDMAERNPIFSRKPLPAKLERYFAAWQLAETPVTERAQTARAIMSKEPNALSQSEWDTLQSLLDSDAERYDFPGPHTVEDAYSFYEVAVSAQHNTYHRKDSLRRYFDAWRMSDTPLETRTQQIHEILSQDPYELSKEDWLRLTTLLDTTPMRLRNSIPYAIDDLTKFASETNQIGIGNWKIGTTIERYFSAYKTNALPAEQAKELALTLFSKNPSDLDRADWLQVAALIDHPTLKNDVRGPYALVGTHHTLRDLLYSVTHFGNTHSLSMNRYVAKWLAALDPNYSEKVNRVMNELAAGKWSDETQTVVNVNFENLSDMIAGRSPQDQVGIAQMIMKNYATEYGSTEDLLKAYKTGLPELKVSANLEPVRIETLRLIDINLSRISGTTPKGETVGFLSYPDFAELGKIRANVAFINDSLRQSTSAAANGAADATNGTQLLW